MLSAGEGGTYQLTPLGETLQTDQPQLSPGLGTLRWCFGALECMGSSLQSVKTGTPGFVLAHGIPTYDFLESHPELAACFNRWMTKQSAQQNSAILDAYDFSKFQVVADIGGGQGSTLAAVLERYPSLRGILFDRPSVVAEPAALAPAAYARAVLL